MPFGLPLALLYILLDLSPSLVDVPLYLRSTLLHLFFDTLPASLYLVLRPLLQLLLDSPARRCAEYGDEGGSQECDGLSLHAPPSATVTLLPKPSLTVRPRNVCAGARLAVPLLPALDAKG